MVLKGDRREVSVNRSSHLCQILKPMQIHMKRLKGIALQSAQNPTGVRHELVPVMVINGINAWSNFARAYVLSSALGTKSIAGISVRCGLPRGKCCNDVIWEILHAINSKKALRLKGRLVPRRDEPTWHDPNTLIVATKALQLSCAGTVQAAMSPFPQYLPDWSCIRNFFAHRNQDTFASALGILSQRYGIVSTKDLGKAVLAPRLNGARPLLWEWADNVEDLCEYLCA